MNITTLEKQKMCSGNKNFVVKYKLQCLLFMIHDNIIGIVYL